MPFSFSHADDELEYYIGYQEGRKGEKRRGAYSAWKYAGYQDGTKKRESQTRYIETVRELRGMPLLEDRFDEDRFDD